MNRVAALVVLGLLASPIAHADPAWSVRPAITHDNLTIFPLVASGSIDAGADLLTFEEADRLSVIEVSEIAEDGAEAGSVQPQHRVDAPIQVQQANVVPDQIQVQQANVMPEQIQVQNVGGGARVNAVAVSNTGDKPILLMAGDVILGGKQDRVIGKDTIVPEGADRMEVGVFCVEHGRWSGQTASFKSSGKLGHSGLRDKAVFNADQSAVWAEVAATNEKNKASNATDTYRATLDSSAAGAAVEATVSRLLPALAAEKQASGLVIAVDGRVVALEGFANPALFAKVREKLVRSYALEAATSDAKNAKAPGAGAVDAFLAEVAKAQETGAVQSGAAANTFEESDAIKGVRTESPGKKAVHQYYKVK